MAKMPLDMADVIKAKGGRRGDRDRKRNADALSHVPLFANLSRRQLNQLAERADEVRFRSGADVIREGDLGEALFVILEGEAKVTRGGRKLAVLEPGDFFGEVSLFDRGPRTATVTAQTPLATVRIFRKGFMKLVESDPKMAEQILIELAGRLRSVEKSLLG
jgi:CRP/FNR family transcriptional regulator, cyclic AMP receptor protein